MEELSSQNLLSKRQRLAWNAIIIIIYDVESKSMASTLRRCYDDKHHEWGWILGCWHVAMFRDIVPKRYDPITLFVEDGINGEYFLIRKNEDSIPVILHVIKQTGASFFPDASELLLPSAGVSWNASDFFLSSPWPSEIEWRPKCSFLFQSCHFLAWVILKAFLMTSWLITWGRLDWGGSLESLRPSNVFPLDEQSFFRRSTALKSQRPWSPA